MTTPETIILLTHLFSTIFMVGVIWFVQVVHYPLLAQVGAEQFVRYESLHRRLTTWVVGPAMLLEAVSAAAMIPFCPPSISSGVAWTGLLLVVVIWGSTALLQVPLHQRLSQGFSELNIARLVSTNWIRTIAWSARGILVAAIVNRCCI